MCDSCENVSTNVHGAIYGVMMCYQSIFADDQKSFGTIDLGQSDFFIESAISSHHHWDAVWEATLRYIRGGAQHRGGEIISLQPCLRNTIKGE